MMSMQMDAEFQKEQNGTLLSGWEHWVVGIGGGGGQGPPNQKIGFTSNTFFFGATCPPLQKLWDTSMKL